MQVTIFVKGGAKVKGSTTFTSQVIKYAAEVHLTNVEFTNSMGITTTADKLTIKHRDILSINENLKP